MKTDDLLVQFMRSNRLEPPPACPELEDRLISQLEPFTAKRLGRSFFWLRIGLGIGLMVGLLGFGQLRRMQTARNDIDHEQLEASLIQNWEASLARSEEFTIDLFNYQEN